ncbi:hypothetical protein ACFUC1_10205 [Pedococcus sp. NPDC057267]|uniref:hypothetical protein n=1 Tax=Pedococcus sp. NPDC057267 TaxID=3346077 RepID=UPI003626F86A
MTSPTTEPRTRTSPTRTPPTRTQRRVGYVAGAVVNALLLVAVNGWPGWDAVPFLTDDTRLVLGWVNASIVVGLLANLLYAVADPPWVRAGGDLVQNLVGLAAMVRLWQVFPVHFAPGGFDWELVARVFLGIGIVGASIAILVALVKLVRRAAA